MDLSQALCSSNKHHDCSTSFIFKGVKLRLANASVWQLSDISQWTKEGWNEFSCDIYTSVSRLLKSALRPQNLFIFRRTSIFCLRFSFVRIPMRFILISQTGARKKRNHINLITTQCIINVCHYPTLCHPIWCVKRTGVNYARNFII